MKISLMRERTTPSHNYPKIVNLLQLKIFKKEFLDVQPMLVTTDMYTELA